MSPPVEQRAVLRTQVQELVEQLHHVERALADARIEARLRARVGVRFQVLIKQRRTSALRLRDQLDGGVAHESAWAELHEIRAECMPLFSESLALVEGALARTIDLDRGLCRVADAMLEEIARLSERPWERFTILADGEYFGDVAEIIRIRFPDVSVWSLPVAAHEFAHYVGRTFAQSSDPTLAAPFKRAEQAGPSALAHLHEHFADFFGTYVMGPAYPCMCVLQRFDPRSAGVASRMHPNGMSRARSSLGVLERMDEDAGLLRPYVKVRALLGDTWQQMVSSASPAPAALSVEAEAALTDLGDQLWTLLEETVPQARYQGWLSAWQVAQTLLEQHRNGAPLCAEASDIRNVLNAAWAARLTGPAALTPALGEWGATACGKLVGDDNGGDLR